MGEFDFTETYDQVLQAKVAALAEEMQSRGVPHAFYVVVAESESGVDAREFAGGHGRFVNSVSFLARNWERMMHIAAAVDRTRQEFTHLIEGLIPTTQEGGDDDE